MRTKILLAAVAAMAAGVLASNAQVYSANIVGYTIKIPSNAPSYSLICNPVDSGNNTISNLFGTTPPAGGSQILMWNGSAYVTAVYTALSHQWKTNGVNANSTLLPPGTGFFIQVAGANAYSNTFVGQVTPLTTVVATNPVPAGFQLLASSVPYSDYVTNAATINISSPAGGTQILLWDEPNQAFDTYVYTALSHTWKLSGVNNTPFLNVGQGFFFNSGSAYNWVQTGP